MGRALKQGLEYFPFDIDFFQDIKIRKLIRYQGGKSITVYTLLLCIIYRDGYYIRWDEELPFIISELSGYDEAYIQEAIKCCLAVGLFNKQLFESDKVLTSKGIQERYMNINKSCKRYASVNVYSCMSEKANSKHFEKVKLVSKDTTDISTIKVSTLDEEIDEMKSSEIWLDSMQNLHHMNVDEIKNKLDDFKLQCVADGKTSHDNINDAKKHFNNWLRIVTSNDKVRTDCKAGRRGNLLKTDEEKTYSNSF
ncbi:DUF4373 domain-containing protein [Prevotella amnii]|jgi:hypothetical protein|uniref:DUF4373 domain-containing protein n=1 Tax=Prevotella amnii TaxID=419005 RepID=UPI00204755E7|nr:MAG TPA: protein of unknown function (DUF4373) [Caudoviricetes sp.]